LILGAAPAYDPWAWIIWGREIAHFQLHTFGGPTWKPLPVLLTTLFAPFGAAAPVLWVLVARAGGLMAVGMAALLAVRAVSSSAGPGWPASQARASARATWTRPELGARDLGPKPPYRRLIPQRPDGGGPDASG